MTAAHASLAQMAATLPVLVGFRPPPGAVVLVAVDRTDGRHVGTAIHGDAELAAKDIPSLATALRGTAAVEDPGVLVFAVQDDGAGLRALRSARLSQHALLECGVSSYYPCVVTVDPTWSQAAEFTLADPVEDIWDRPDERHDLLQERSSFMYLRTLHALGEPHDSLVGLVRSYRSCAGPLRDEIADALPGPHDWGPKRSLGRHTRQWVRQDSATRAWQRLTEPVPLTGREAAPILLSLADREVSQSFQGWMARDMLPEALRPAAPNGESLVHDHLRALALMAPPDLLDGISQVLATEELVRGGGRFRALAAWTGGHPTRESSGTLPGPERLRSLAVRAGSFTDRPMPIPVDGPWPDPLAGGNWDDSIYWACVPPSGPTPPTYRDPLLPPPDLLPPPGDPGPDPLGFGDGDGPAR